jgi:hypothetical protein
VLAPIKGIDGPKNHESIVRCARVSNGVDDIGIRKG